MTLPHSINNCAMHYEQPSKIITRKITQITSEINIILGDFKAKVECGRRS